MTPRGRLARRAWPIVCLIGAVMPLPAVRADTADDELAKQVTIRRDQFGVPHLLGQTEEAAYFGQGYACAEDHVLVMARLFLRGRGEEAAQFGEAFVEGDFAIKQLRLWEGAREGYARMAPWVQRLLDAYAAGYNRYVKKHRDKLPEWVKPVTGIDVLAHGRRVTIVEFTMDRRVLQNMGYKAAALPREDDTFLAKGSNMWAIGKGRTTSGKGILLGNPHLTWSGQYLFYECHLTVPNKVNLYGCSTVASPGITIGFNDHLGWSHTVNLHDSDDVYELTLDPKDRDRYLYDGKSLPLTKEEISIQVKTDAGTVTRKREVLRSHYGPTKKLPLGNKALAWKSANFDEYRFVEQWNLMGKAKSLQEFRNVLDMQAIPMFNICYADREGNVFYLFNGRFPDRPKGYPWDAVVPGNTSATEWSRLLPQSRLPSLINPPGGYVQNCNSAPWYTNLKQIIDRSQYPDDLTPNFCLMRQQLSLQMLDGDKPIDLQKVLKDKYNLKLLLADRVKPDVLKLLEGGKGDPELVEALAVLGAWDHTVARDSRGSVLFVNFWKRYCELCRKPDRLEWMRALYAVPWDEKRPAETPSGLGNRDAARSALRAAVQEVKKNHGKLDVAWGEVHRLRRGNLDLPIGGFADEGGFPIEYGAFRILRYDPDKDGKLRAIGGDSFVLAVEFTTPPTAYSISAYSQSSDPQSPHHTDQCALFADEKWKRAWFTEEDIQRHLERSYQP